jgi:hypothetical protein
VRVRWGSHDLGGTWFRNADITVPLLIDAAAAFGP